MKVKKKGCPKTSITNRQLDCLTLENETDNLFQMSVDRQTDRHRQRGRDREIEIDR